MAFGKIKITQADKTFSLFIRTRDEWTCQYCGKECIARKYGVDIALVKMDCAHIMPRNHQSTRYNPTNAICLCFRCHQGFSHAEKEFPNWEKWNKKRMGKGNYELLKYMSKQRGHKLNKTEEKILVIALKQEINALNRR